MTTASFTPGEVVLLKSGGPTMTVASVSGQFATCVWIEKNKTFREDFEFVILEKYTNPFAGL